MAETPGTAWVCIDCYLAHNGFLEALEAETDRKRRTDCEPLSMLGDCDVTAGLLDSEHADDCLRHTLEDDAPADYDCDCEHQTFSWSRCDGCGSALGGSRHAMTLWEVS